MKIELQEPYASDFDYGHKVLDKKQNRYQLQLYCTGGYKTSTSYARYVMAVHLGYYISDEYEVDHKDDNKLNDDINNLQLLTRKEQNEKHKCDITANIKLTDQQIRQIKFLYFLTSLEQFQIANLYNTSQANISFILSGKRRKYIKLDTNNKLQMQSLRCMFRRYLAA